MRTIHLVAADIGIEFLDITGSGAANNLIEDNIVKGVAFAVHSQQQ